MASASSRLQRRVLAVGTGLAAFLLSPFAAYVSAENEGLGAGGAAFAFNYTLVLGILLAFILGFGLRDYIHKRMLRAQSAKKPTAAPPRM